MKVLRTFLLLTMVGSLVASVGCQRKERGHVKGQGSGGEDAPPPKKGGYTEVEVANGGTVTGTIKYSGSKTDPKIEITKDGSVCGSGSIAADALKTSGGNLEGALVALEGIKEGKAWGDAGTPTVDNIKCIFVPRFAIGRQGAEMIAKNSDAVLHNTHLYLKLGAKRKNLKNIALPNLNQTIPYKMKKPGLMDVRCDAHEWMQGWVWVSPHPYAAVTDASGQFTMSDVPPGEYSARIWHEMAGEHTATVTVSAGGSATLDHTFN